MQIIDIVYDHIDMCKGLAKQFPELEPEIERFSFCKLIFGQTSSDRYIEAGISIKFHNIDEALAAQEKCMDDYLHRGHSAKTQFDPDFSVCINPDGRAIFSATVLEHFTPLNLIQMRADYTLQRVFKIEGLSFNAKCNLLKLILDYEYAKS